MLIRLLLKKSSEKFSESMKSCSIYDVIENKGQKIYIRGDGTNIMIRNSDFKA
jgi:hypothetical protein